MSPKVEEPFQDESGVIISDLFVSAFNYMVYRRKTLYVQSLGIHQQKTVFMCNINR